MTDGQKNLSNLLAASAIISGVICVGALGNRLENIRREEYNISQALRGIEDKMQGQIQTANVLSAEAPETSCDTRNLFGATEPETFCDANGKRYFLEIDGKPVEQYVKERK